VIVYRNGATVRLYTRRGNNWTSRLPAIAAAAARIKAKSFTIDGEAVVAGPDGLSRFEELRRREAARTAILYPFDLIEHDGEDLRNCPFLDRKDALARLLRDIGAGILLNERVAEDGPAVFAHACRVGAEGIVSMRVDGTYRSGPCPVWMRGAVNFASSSPPRRSASAGERLPSFASRPSGLGDQPILEGAVTS
jgi:bifunctional non-homologous end joining protein LigD